METSASRPGKDLLNPFLARCPEQTRALLMQAGTPQAFEQGSLLYSEGQPTGVVVFLLRGALQMSRSAARGRRQVFCNLSPTTCDGICLLLMADRGLADVRALTAGEMLALPREDFQRLARLDPVLCQAAWGSAAQCMGHLANLVEHLSFDKVSERLVATLLARTERDGDQVRLTQSELAAEVGTTREVVARCLANLREAGAIRLGRGRITVLGRDRLQQVPL